MRSRSMVSDFTEGNITKQLFTFAFPLFLSSLLQVLYNMADMIIVGHALGKVGLSAVSVGGDVSNFLTFVAMGFCSAGQVIISQYIGAGKRERISPFVGTMFTTLMLCAVCLSSICLFLRTPILNVMNTPPEAFSEALRYSTVCMCGLVFIYGYNICSAVLRGMGNSRHPFIFIAISAVLNVVLDLLFVLVFDMAAMGAALATVLSQAVSFICCAVFLYKRRETSGLDIRLCYFVRLRGDMLSSLLKLGVPMAIKSAAIHVSKLFVNSWINSYGVEVSAFAGIANKINSISNLISNSLNTSGSSMVGQNIAAQKHKRVLAIVRTIAITTVCIATTLSAAILIFPEHIFRIFVDDASVLEVAMDYLPIAVLIFFGSAARAPMNSLINGSGQTSLNFATAIFDGIIMRLGLSVLFGLVLDMKHFGFWLGDACAGFTPFVIGMVFLLSGKWKKAGVKMK
ncbi:MAG: MATE family efflux transporter [Clostridia bacterium]|nr:MATE family efflux transporter [Clostridia bacterium]